MRARKAIIKAITYALLIMGSIMCSFPLIWMVRSSLMGIGQIFNMPPIWFPNPIKIENYYRALTILPFGRYFLNTITIVITGVVGATLTSSICAFSFARLRWKGRDKVFSILLTSMMLPYAVTLIPTFIGWKILGYTNTFLPLIIPSWFGGGVFNIFLLRQFFLTIPKELDEAAYVDGAGYLRIYAQIILPLVKPALIVVALFTFLSKWNDFLGPLIYLNDEKKYTLALGLQQFKGMYNAQWDLMMAAATVVIMPVLIVFIIGQKYFIEGITLTGLKG